MAKKRAAAESNKAPPRQKKRKQEASARQMKQKQEAPPNLEPSVDRNRRKRWITSKCSPGYLEEIFSEAKRKGLSVEQKTELEKTPFHEFINMPDFCVSKVFIEVILEQWDIEKGGLQLGDGFAEFLPEHIALLLGIPAYGNKVVWQMGDTTPSVTLETICGGKLSSFKAEKIGKDLVALAGQSGAEEAKQFTRLYLTLLFSSFLFPTSNVRPARELFLYLDDIDSLKTYNWAAAVHTYLTDSIKKAVEKMRTGSEGGICVQGCTAVLLVS
jgi:hypothetical protein